MRKFDFRLSVFCGGWAIAIIGAVLLTITELNNRVNGTVNQATFYFVMALVGFAIAAVSYPDTVPEKVNAREKKRVP